MSRMVTAPGRARAYETIYILRPDIDAESAEKVGARVSEVVSKENGKLTQVELWGRRRLAYDIAKHKRGVYVFLKYLGDGKVVAEVERNLRLSDGVLKYQTVLVENNVEAAGLEVSSDAVKFERLELPPIEDDREDSRERQLGLIEPERAPARHEGDAADLEGYEAGEDGPADDEET
ncbi:MAG TPA: 30S ribosomal protein S6 [Polyangiaceae bacterium]|nr:30S ribosomal protein S6 [Polyangiaceae bacterium]